MNEQSESAQNGFGHYNPVTVKLNESVGTLFLGILAVMLLVVFIRSYKQNQTLIERIGELEDRLSTGAS